MVAESSRSDEQGRVPRRRQGSPPSLLLNLFGAYWWDRPEPMPSAALVTLLGDFGVSDVSARAALSRMSKHGLIDATRTGRNTAYQVTPRGEAVLRNGLRRLQNFGREPESWDARWRILVLPSLGDRRSLRDAVRARLRWLGFAALTDDMWVSPHERLAAARDALTELGIVDPTLLIAEVAPDGAGGRDPRTAWDLSELIIEYRTFIAACAEMRDAATAGTIEPARALVDRTRLGDLWFDFSRADPDLPAELLPPSGRAPRRARRWYFSPELVRQARSILQDKMLFGSDFPAITPDRWLADFAALPIKDAARPKILKDNAVALLGLS